MSVPSSIDLVRDYEQIAALDPLLADDIYRELPRMNQQGDVASLLRALRRLDANVAKIRDRPPHQALAAMRDLGMLLGSIKRHGVEPLRAAPEVQHTLLDLAQRTEMAPRDTVYHYGPWNPAGARQRMFTGDPQEGSIIDSVRLSFPPLARAVRLCLPLQETPLDDPDFPVIADELAESLTVLESAIDLVVETVDPLFFAQSLRPYFEEVEIGGRPYLGGAGAGLPIPLIDLALWASDHRDADYEAFWRQGANYTLPEWRHLYSALESRPSLVTKVTTALSATSAESTAGPRACAAAIERCLRALTVFRAKHFTIARKSYREEVRLYPVGSSGGSTELLDQILTLTRANITLIRRSKPGPPR